LLRKRKRERGKEREKERERGKKRERESFYCSLKIWIFTVPFVVPIPVDSENDQKNICK